MTLAFNLLTVFRSVLLAALIGATDAPGNVVNPGEGTPKKDNPNVEVVTQAVKKSQQAEAAPQMQAQIEAMQEQLDDLYSDVRKAKRRSGILFVVVIALGAAGYVFINNLKKSQEERDVEQDRKLKELAKKLNKTLEDTSSALDRKVKDLQDDNARMAAQQKQQASANNAQKTNQSDPSSHTAGNSSSNDNKVKQQPAQQPKSVVKYFMLNEIGGRLLARERNLKDDPVSWFRMEINGNRATYDINRKMLGEILSDMATLRICTKDFESKSGARDIVTQKQGTMEKTGTDWIVTEKLAIKLS